MTSLVIRDWKTILSTCDELYSLDLLFDGSLVFRVQDRAGTVFVVTFSSPGPFRVAEEAFFVWMFPPNTTGWTYMCEGADWPIAPPDFTADYRPGMKHYGIATMDVWLEVLSAREPSIEVTTPV